MYFMCTVGAYFFLVHFPLVIHYEPDNAVFILHWHAVGTCQVSMWNSDIWIHALKRWHLFFFFKPNADAQQNNYYFRHMCFSDRITKINSASLLTYWTNYLEVSQAKCLMNVQLLCQWGLLRLTLPKSKYTDDESFQEIWRWCWFWLPLYRMLSLCLHSL